MISDKQDLLIKYDIKNNTTIQIVKLPLGSHEGLCFDDKNNVYIAHDDGKISKCTQKQLKLEKVIAN